MLILYIVNNNLKYQPSDITVYIPYYNASSTVDRCLAAISAQTINPSRVFVVDDGSDVPFSISGVEVIKHMSNKGLAAARNTAIDACKTSLLAALDSDVLPDPEWLESLLAVLNNEDCIGAGGMMTERYAETVSDRWRAVHMAQHWGDESVRNPRFLFGANTLFVTEKFRDVGGYDKRHRTNDEDRAISDALYAKGLNLMYVPEARCEHLRQDTVDSILKGYWQWHHTKGLINGDYNSAQGIISRIEAVNFGIFKYRFHVDEEAGRNDLMALDMMIPWVFCAMDIAMLNRETGIDVPCFPGERLLDEMPDIAARLLREMVPERGSATIGGSWCLGYFDEFRRNLKSSGWIESADDYISFWKGFYRDVASWTGNNESMLAGVMEK